jgi:transcriptional regulator with XRE-family HTH domain
MPIRLRVRELRNKQGLTLQDIEQKSGMSASSINRIERGDRGWTDDSLEKIAHALGVKAVELIDESEGQISAAIDDPDHHEPAESEEDEASEKCMNGASLGERLRNRREELRLSSRDVADAIGISHTALNNWERGVNAPRSKYASALARKLDMRLEDLNPYLEPDLPEDLAPGAPEKVKDEGAVMRFAIPSGSRVSIEVAPDGAVEIMIEQRTR